MSLDTKTWSHYLLTRLQVLEGEYGLRSGAVYIAFFLVALAALHLFDLLPWSSKKQSASSLPVPPGSLGLPILGDTLQYIKVYYNMDTKRYFDEKVKKYGPVFKMSLFGKKTVYIDCPAGSKFLSKVTPDEEFIQGSWPYSVKQIMGPHSSPAKVGKRYMDQRVLMLGHFLGVDMVHRYIPLMEKYAKYSIQNTWSRYEDGSEVAAYSLIKDYSFKLMADLCLGLHDSALMSVFTEYYDAFTRGISAIPINLPGFAFHKGIQARKNIEELLVPHFAQVKQDLKERRCSETRDFLTVCLTKPDQRGHFYEGEELSQMLLHVLWSGYDTTGSTLTLMMGMVSQHPEVYEELIKEHSRIASRKAEGEPLNLEDVQSMVYTWRVVQECLRLAPIVQSLYREVRAPFEYNGYNIPKGWIVAVSAAQSHWSADLYKDPEKFDPSRWEQTGGGAPPFSWFPFGLGHRLCPGYNIAKLSMLTFFHHFLKNIQWSKADPNEKLVYASLPAYEKGLTIKIQKCKAF